MLKALRLEQIMQSTANCFKNERIEDNYKDPSWEGALSRPPKNLCKRQKPRE